MNPHIRFGKCPDCFGQGWVPRNRPDDGESIPCPGCGGTGTLADRLERKDVPRELS